MVLAIPLKQLMRANKMRGRGAEVELSRPTLADEALLWSVYHDEVLKPWLDAINNRIMPQFTRAPALTLDADGSQLQWLVDQVRREIENRRVYQTERLGQWVTGQGNRATRQAERAIRGATGVNVAPYMRLGDIQPALRIAIGQNVALITRLNGDNAARVQRLLLDSFTNRWSRERTARELRAAMGITWRRARLIVKDQTHKLNTELTKIRMAQLGVKKYKWRTMRDSRVRPTHRAREGRTYTYARGPRTGPPGYEINCFTGSTKVSLANGLNKLYRRFYSGQIVTVVTSEGGLLEATLNHPILTDRGWIPINDINEGDYVVKAVLNSVLVAKDDCNRLETRFDSLFESLHGFEKLTSTRGTILDFHGDGSNDDIDVISTDRFLPYCVRSRLFDRVKQFALTYTAVNFLSTCFNGGCTFFANFFEKSARHVSDFFVRSARTFQPFFWSHFGIHDIVGVFPASDRFAAFNERSQNDTTRDFESSCQSKNAFTFAIERNKSFRQINSVVRSHFRTLKLRILSADRLRQRVVMATKQSGHIFDCPTFRYEFHRVTDKTVREFSGHVYNLSNDLQWYVADGYVVHNCRCHAEAILPT